jgi:hypothetical protein
VPQSTLHEPVVQLTLQVCTDPHVQLVPIEQVVVTDPPSPGFESPGVEEPAPSPGPISPVVIGSKPIRPHAAVFATAIATHNQGGIPARRAGVAVVATSPSGRR